MPRRGKGDGLIHQRSDGRWEARVDVGWRDGRRVRKSIYGRTRREVARALRDAQSTLDQTGVLGDDSITICAFLNQWLTEVVAPRRELATWRGYETNVRRHIVPIIGHVRLTKLSAAMVQRLLNDLRRQGLAPRTVQYVHATLRAALNVALRWGLVQRNVATAVDPVTVKRKEVAPFTPEEARQILDTAQVHRLASFFTVAMALGLRPSEALGLTLVRHRIRPVPSPCSTSSRARAGRLSVQRAKVAHEPAHDRPTRGLRRVAEESSNQTGL